MSRFLPENHGKKFLTEKVAALLLCSSGILMLFYGMIKDQNIVFIVGLALFVAGYLLVRKGLKRELRNKEKDSGIPE